MAAKHWSVGGQSITGGSSITGDWVDCTTALGVSFWYQYTRASGTGPTILLEGSFDGGSTAITVKSLTPGTGSGVTGNLAWVGTATAVGSPTVTESAAAPAPLVRMKITAASFNDVTAASFAVIAGG